MGDYLLKHCLCTAACPTPLSESSQMPVQPPLHPPASRPLSIFLLFFLYFCMVYSAPMSDSPLSFLQPPPFSSLSSRRRPTQRTAMPVACFFFQQLLLLLATLGCSLSLSRSLFTSERLLAGSSVHLSFSPPFPAHGTFLVCSSPSTVPVLGVAWDGLPGTGRDADQDSWDGKPGWHGVWGGHCLWVWPALLWASGPVP